MRVSPNRSLSRRAGVIKSWLRDLEDIFAEMSKDLTREILELANLRDIPAADSSLVTYALRQDILAESHKS